MSNSDFLYENIIQTYTRIGNVETLDVTESSSEISILLATLNVFRSTDDHSLMASFFQEFNNVLHRMDAESLSLMWGKEEFRKKLLGFPDLKSMLCASNNSSNVEDAKELFGIILQTKPELLGSSMDHDPLHVVFRLVESCRQSILLVYSAEERVSIFDALMTMGIKSARCSILLETVWSLLSFSESLFSLQTYEFKMNSNSFKSLSHPNCDAITDASFPILMLDDMRHFIKSCDSDAESGMKNKHDVDNIPVVDRIRNKCSNTNINKATACKEASLYEWGYPSLLAHHDSEETRTVCVSFGKADHGKLGHGDTSIHRHVPTVIDSLRDIPITKTTSMSTYVIALDKMGSPYVWGTGGSAGNNADHSASNSQSLRVDIKPQLLEALPDKIRVSGMACGLGHALFLASGTGRVLSWGNGGNGRLGLDDLHDRSEACPVIALSHEQIVLVQCGASHSLAVTVTGKLYAWGKNSQGQCGIGNLDDVLKPTLVSSLSQSKNKMVRQVAAGWEHTVILTTTGLVYACGCGYKDNRRGIVPPVLGLGHNDGKSVPELLSSLLDAIPGGGVDDSGAIDKLDLPVVGGVCGGSQSTCDFDVLTCDSAKSMDINIRIVNISCGWDHCLALDDRGRTFSWGSGQNGKLGHGNEENMSIPCIIPALENVVVDIVSAGCEHSCAVCRDSGIVYTWGHGDGGRLGHGDNAPKLLPTKVKALSTMNVKPIDVHCGDKFTVMVVQQDSSAGDVDGKIKRSDGMGIEVSVCDSESKWNSSAPMYSFSNLISETEKLHQILECNFDDIFNNSENSAGAKNSCRSLVKSIGNCALCDDAIVASDGDQALPVSEENSSPVKQFPLMNSLLSESSDVHTSDSTVSLLRWSPSRYIRLSLLSYMAQCCIINQKKVEYEEVLKRFTPFLHSPSKKLKVSNHIARDIVMYLSNREYSVESLDPNTFYSLFDILSAASQSYCEKCSVVQNSPVSNAFAANVPKSMEKSGIVVNEDWRNMTPKHRGDSSIISTPSTLPKLDYSSYQSPAVPEKWKEFSSGVKSSGGSGFKVLRERIMASGEQQKLQKSGSVASSAFYPDSLSSSVDSAMFVAPLSLNGGMTLFPNEDAGVEDSRPMVGMSSCGGGDHRRVNSAFSEWAALYCVIKILDANVVALVSATVASERFNRCSDGAGQESVCCLHSKIWVLGEEKLRDQPTRTPRSVAADQKVAVTRGDSHKQGDDASVLQHNHSTDLDGDDLSMFDTFLDGTIEDDLLSNASEEAHQNQVEFRRMNNQLEDDEQEVQHRRHHDYAKMEDADKRNKDCVSDAVKATTDDSASKNGDLDAYEDTFDMQQALLMSLAEDENGSLHGMNDDVVQQFKRRQAESLRCSSHNLTTVFPQLRDALEDLITYCYKVVSTSYGYAIDISPYVNQNGAAREMGLSKSILEKCGRTEIILSSHSLWFQLNTVLSDGFLYFYNCDERRKLLIELFNRPKNVLHLCPVLYDAVCTHDVCKTEWIPDLSSVLNTQDVIESDGPTGIFICRQYIKGLEGIVEHIKTNLLAGSLCPHHHPQAFARCDMSSEGSVTLNYMNSSNDGRRCYYAIHHQILMSLVGLCKVFMKAVVYNSLLYDDANVNITIESLLKGKPVAGSGSIANLLVLIGSSVVDDVRALCHWCCVVASSEVYSLNNFEQIEYVLNHSFTALMTSFMCEMLGDMILKKENRSRHSRSLLLKAVSVIHSSGFVDMLLIALDKCLEKVRDGVLPDDGVARLVSPVGSSASIESSHAVPFIQLMEKWLLGLKHKALSLNAAAICLLLTLRCPTLDEGSIVRDTTDAFPRANGVVHSRCFVDIVSGFLHREPAQWNMFSRDVYPVISDGLLIEAMQHSLLTEKSQQSYSYIDCSCILSSAEFSDIDAYFSKSEKYHDALISLFCAVGVDTNVKRGFTDSMANHIVASGNDLDFSACLSDFASVVNKIMVTLFKLLFSSGSNELGRKWIKLFVHDIQKNIPLEKVEYFRYVGNYWLTIHMIVGICVTLFVENEVKHKGCLSENGIKSWLSNLLSKFDCLDDVISNKRQLAEKDCDLYSYCCCPIIVPDFFTLRDDGDMVLKVETVEMVSKIRCRAVSFLESEFSIYQEHSVCSSKLTESYHDLLLGSTAMPLLKSTGTVQADGLSDIIIFCLSPALTDVCLKEILYSNSCLSFQDTCIGVSLQLFTKMLKFVSKHPRSLNCFSQAVIEQITKYGIEDGGDGTLSIVYSICSGASDSTNADTEEKLHIPSISAENYCTVAKTIENLNIDIHGLSREMWYRDRQISNTVLRNSCAAVLPSVTSILKIMLNAVRFRANNDRGKGEGSDYLAVFKVIGSINRKMSELTTLLKDQVPPSEISSFHPAMSPMEACTSLDKYIVDDILYDCLESMKYLFTSSLKVDSSSASCIPAKIRVPLVSDSLLKFLDVLKCVSNYCTSLLEKHFVNLWKCYHARVSYCMAQRHALESTSPNIVSNLVSGFGYFTLGFWIFIPEESIDRALASTCDDANNKLYNSSTEVHVISRVPESNDFNMIDLIDNKRPCLSHPHVSLKFTSNENANEKDCSKLKSKGSVSLCVTSTAIVTCDGVHSCKFHKETPNGSGGKCVKLESKKLLTNRWIKVTVSFQQSVIPSTPSAVGCVPHSGPHSISVPNKRGVLVLGINDEIVDEIDGCLLKAHSSHQNAIIGSLPKFLKRYDSEISVCDVFWSSIPLRRIVIPGETEPSYRAVSIHSVSSLDSATAAKLLKEHPAVHLSGNTDQTADETFNPHGIHISLLENVFVSMNNSLYALQVSLKQIEQEFDIFQKDACNHDGNTSEMVCFYDGILALFPKYCDSVITYLVTGNEEVQDLVLKILKSLVLLVAKLSKSDGAQQLPSINEVRSYVMFTVNYVVEHVHLMLDIKGTLNSLSKHNYSFQLHKTCFRRQISSFLSIIAECEVESIRGTLPVGSEISLDIRALADIWIDRVGASVVGLERIVNVAEWSHVACINESIIVSGVASVLSSVINSSSDSSNLLCDIYTPTTISKWYQYLQNASISSITESENLYQSARRCTREMLILVCGGGWPTVLGVHRKVEFSPRALFLFSDPKYMEHSLFAAEATIVRTNYMRSGGVWLSNCAGTFNKIDCIPVLIDGSSRHGKDLCVIVPNSATNTMISSTEMVSGHDLFKVTTVGSHKSVIEAASLQQNSSDPSDVLLDILKDHHLPSNFELVKLLKTALSLSNSLPETGSSTKEAKPDTDLKINLRDAMILVRSLMVQMVNVEMKLKSACDSNVAGKDEILNIITDLLPILLRDLTPLQSVAIMNPIAAVNSVFNEISQHITGQASSTSKTSKSDEGSNACSTATISAAYRTAQLDVLNNLLADGDVCFLEKIAQRYWSRIKDSRKKSSLSNISAYDFNHYLDVFYIYHHQMTEPPTFAATDTASNVNNKDYKLGIEESYLQYVSPLWNSHDFNVAFASASLSSHIAPLAGEVHIYENRVRGLSQFPSVMLQDVAIKKRSGRWYYEATLLSDGLMQIGWADNLFKCDPSCGQGVGDHLHSWAYDGMRSKRWNVSCEPYGKRWKVGDVVGCLLDTDLLEMRYFLNGEDMGVAFSEFKCNMISPAVSLNIRQCVRLNFGECLFIFPPDREYDGQAFRSIREAFVMQNSHISSKNQDSISKSAPDLRTVGDANWNPPNTSLAPMESVAAVHSNMGTIRAHRVEVMRDGGHDEEIVFQEGGPGEDGAEVSHVVGATRVVMSMLDDHSHDGNGTEDDIDAERNGEDDGVDDDYLAARLVNRPHLSLGVNDDIDNDDDSDNNSDKDDSEDSDNSENDDEDFDENEENVDNEDDNKSENFDEENHQELELRRQSMVENLVALGFPIEWVLRAAEHCDLSTPEANVVSWILEKMETEQNRIDEYTGDSSRVMDEEQQHQVDSSHEMAAQHNVSAAAHNEITGGDVSGHELLAAILNSNNSSSNLVAIASYINNTCHTDTGATTASIANALRHLANGTSLEGGEAKEEEHNAAIMAINNAFQEISSRANNSNSSNASDRNILHPTNSMWLRNILGNSSSMASPVARLSELDHSDGSDHQSAHLMGGSHGAVDDSNRLLDEVGCGYNGALDERTWNDPTNPSVPVLMGRYTAKRRQDGDKEDVLSQVSELEHRDMYPIVASCEFSLCIQYCRTISTKILSIVSMLHSLRECSDESELAVSEANEKMDRIISQLMSHMLADADSLPFMHDILRIGFKQSICTSSGNNNSERLFPTFANGNSNGEPQDRIPYCIPFSSSMCNTLDMHLQHLECVLYKDNLLNTLASEESFCQSRSAVERFLGVLIKFCNRNKLCSAAVPPELSENYREIRKYCEMFLLYIVQESIDSIQNSSKSNKYDRRDLIQLSLKRDLTDNAPAAVTAGARMASGAVGMAGLIAASLGISDGAVAPLDAKEAADDITKRNSISASIDAATVLAAAAKKHGKFLIFPVSDSYKNRPFVLWAHFFLRFILKEYHLVNNCYSSDGASPLGKFNLFHNNRMIGADDNENVSDEELDAASSVDSNLSVSFSFLSKLTSSSTLGELLKASSTSNMSLKFCIFDVGSHILSLVNMQLNKYQVIRRRRISEMILEQNRKNDEVANGEAVDSINETAALHISPDPAELHLAAEYYVAVTKERKLLQVFSSKLRQEASSKLFSLYTRSIARFLFQWQNLRKVLGLFNDGDIVRDCLTESWKSGSLYVHNYETDVTTKCECSVAQQQKRDEILVQQISSNSITVSWSFVNPVRVVHAAAETKETDEDTDLSLNPLPEGGKSSLKPQVFVSPKCVLALYIAPANNTGLEGQVLVLSDMGLQGTHRIDKLDADTMYRITVLKRYERMGVETPSVVSDASSDRVVVLVGVENDVKDVEDTDLSLGHRSENGKADAESKNMEIIFEVFDDEMEKDQQGGSIQDFKGALEMRDDLGSGANSVTSTKEDEMPSEPTSQSIFVSTYADPIFLFDHKKLVVPNLILSSTLLTVKNGSNKKWSTVRGNVKMTTGIYRWDVHVDKCISKNIFVGVCTEEAKLNNYVGCDKYGWAFLANRAIWHNKGKLKSYGELFHGGDTISVLLDMDNGVLQYWLNGNPMGIAVEGLLGLTLYPAFSLYNEDDQLSLVQSKCNLHTGNAGSNSKLDNYSSYLTSCGFGELLSRGGASPGSSVNTTTGGAERVLDRVMALQSLLEYLDQSIGHFGENACEEHDPSLRVPYALPKDIRLELYRRHKLWSNNAFIRSIMHHNTGDYLSIVVSNNLCEMFSKDCILHIGDVVEMEGQMYSVVGVACHEMWFQMEISGEFVCCTRATLSNLISRNKFRVITSLSHHISELSCVERGVQGENLKEIGVFKNIDDFSSIVQTFAVMWTREEDELLIEFLDRVAAYISCHPVLIPKETLIAALNHWRLAHVALGGDDDLKNMWRLFGQTTECCRGYYAKLFEHHSDVDIILRSLLLIHTNDILLALQPLITPTSGDENIGNPYVSVNGTCTVTTTAESNYPVHWLVSSMKGYLFSQYHMDLASRLSVKTTNFPGDIRDTISPDSENIGVKKNWSAGVCLHSVSTSFETFSPSNFDYVDSYDEFQGTADSRSLLINSALEISNVLASSSAGVGDDRIPAKNLEPPPVSCDGRVSAVATVDEGVSAGPSVLSAALACMQFVNDSVGTISKAISERESIKSNEISRLLMVSTVAVHALPAISTSVVGAGHRNAPKCLSYTKFDAVSSTTLKGIVMRRLKILSRSNSTCNCQGKASFDAESISASGSPTPYTYSCLALSPQIFFIEDDHVIIKRMVNETVFSSSKATVRGAGVTGEADLMNAESVGGVGKILLKDPRWMLIAGIQASLVGQFRVYLENVASLPQNDVGVANNASATGHFVQSSQLPCAWEESLRLFFKWDRFDISNADVLPQASGAWKIIDRLFKYDSVGLKKHISSVVPFVTRLQSIGSVRENDDIASWELNIFTALALLEQEQEFEMKKACRIAIKDIDTQRSKGNVTASCRNIPNPEYGGSCSLVSEWFLLELFILEALKQAQKFMRKHLFLGENVDSCRVFVKFSALSPGEASIILQFFQVIGVLVGLALRLQLNVASTGAFSDFPLEFCKVLVGDCSQINMQLCDRVDAVFTNSLLLAMRAGIVSVYSEVMLKMLKAERFHYLICRRKIEKPSTFAELRDPVSVKTIQQLSSYIMVKSTDNNEKVYCWNRNIKMLWLMLSQLSDSFISFFVSSILGLLICDDILRDQINLVLFCHGGLHEDRLGEEKTIGEDTERPILLYITNNERKDSIPSSCGSIFKLSRVKNDKDDGFHVELYVPAHSIISLRDMMADFVTVVLSLKCSNSQ